MNKKKELKKLQDYISGLCQLLETTQQNVLCMHNKPMLYNLRSKKLQPDNKKRNTIALFIGKVRVFTLNYNETIRTEPSRLSTYSQDKNSTFYLKGPYLKSIIDDLYKSNKRVVHHLQKQFQIVENGTHYKSTEFLKKLSFCHTKLTDDDLESTISNITEYNRENRIAPNSTNISPADLTHFNNITSTNSLIVTDSNRIVPNHLSTKDLPTKIVNKHKKTDLNTTNSKNLNSTIDKKVLEYEDSLAFVTNKITSSNRANKIASGYYVNNIDKNNSQFNLFIYNDTLRASPPLITERTNSTWLIPLIVAGGVISLVVIGIFTMFKRKQSRHQTQNTKEHIPSSEKRNSEEKHSSVQLEDYSLRRSRSSTSLKSRRYTLSSPESIEKLNTEQELPSGVIVDPNQESCAFIIQPSSGV
ncbi:MAG: hypothetical protein KTV77_02975 [Wolbachia endosymbiont of Fragariocoptes setiger]|nr:hypothetical protein [Wolbachia endosymbiont of Fragariocoptes setiger]